MSIAEIILLVLLLIGGYRGFKKGLLQEVVAWIALVLGLIAGSVFLEEGKAFIGSFFSAYSSMLPVLSFVLIFVVVVMLANIAGRLLKSTIAFTPIQWLDSASGAVLGVLKWLFFISLLLWGLDLAEISIHGIEQSEWYGSTKVFAPLVVTKLNTWFPVIQEIVLEVEKFFESLKT